MSRHPRIVTSYEIVTPESAAEGGVAESGWDDKEGEEFELEEGDIDEGITIADHAAKWLRNQGATEASSTIFHRGVWYTAYGEADFRTGNTTNHSFHLKGFNEWQERAIFEKMTRRGHGDMRIAPRSTGRRRPIVVTSFHGTGARRVKRTLTLPQWMTIVKALRSKNRRPMNRDVAERWWNAGHSPEEAAKGI